MSRIGRFEIQQQIAKGTRSTTYRGIDAETQRPVAIKAIPHEAVDPRAVVAFAKVESALLGLEHPGIARFLGKVDTAKQLCLVTEFVEGQPLTSLLKEQQHPEPLVAWDIIRQLLEALAVAHVMHAVHRDLRPSKVVLAADGRARLLDFGSSALYAGNVRPVDVRYFAPEHFGEGKVGPRSDLYQMGILVYQLVTGRVPFTGAPEEIEHRVLQERPTDPSSYNNKLAWQLDWVVQKALSKDASERFASALEFGEGLRLGLQDTVGRPLEPVKINAGKPAEPQNPATPAPTAAPPAAATPAKPAAQALQANARLLAEKAAATSPAKALAASATQAPPASATPKAATASAKPAAAPDRSALDPKKPTVLFVDDDARILTAVKSLFRLEYNTLTAESGAAALEILAKVKPQIVVSDQRMPAMTGVELLRKVREAAPQAVRILLTGYTDLAALVGSINQGEIFRFVKKPWDNDELKKALAEAALAAKAAAASAVPAPSGVAPVAPPTEIPKVSAPVLVIAASDGVGKGLERLLGGNAPVRQAPNAQEAAKLLAREEVCAIVADMGTGMDGLVALFREVKAKRPHVLSILLTDAPDSELAIDLVNRAQIFRYLPKPVSARELRAQVVEALKRFVAARK